MVDRVRRWVTEGRKVRIFTARVAGVVLGRDMEEAKYQQQLIQAWCTVHLGFLLPITCVKDKDMIELWDDRCVAVEPNTGGQLSPSRRGLA
jgi:hypothetical protein